ncbi:hypothetical protein [Scrofimicrobium canadense]|nr:hypothetical protein [Scrofimicrobium canadense]
MSINKRCGYHEWDDGAVDDLYCILEDGHDGEHSVRTIDLIQDDEAIMSW